MIRDGEQVGHLTWKCPECGATLVAKVRTTTKAWVNIYGGRGIAIKRLGRFYTPGGNNHPPDDVAGWQHVCGGSR